MITPRKKGELDAYGSPTEEQPQVDMTSTDAANVRASALGQLKDKLLNTVAPPKQDDPVFKLKRLVRAGVPNPLQTALAQKAGM